MGRLSRGGAFLGMDEAHDSTPERSLEAQRVFATVARSMLGMAAQLPTIERFEVRERIGSGGMGEVYGAYDPQRERPVAIKVLRNDRKADGAAIRRLEREARALARLDHPHVVRILEVGTLHSQIFIVMERLRGQTLAAHLQVSAPLPPPEAFRMLAQVCEALDHAHRLGIIHRDLKPGNIFLAEDPEDPQTKVLDFGLAKIASEGTFDVSTASGTVMGTLHYMSPEQARDSTKIDHRCDLWAVAIIAYECMVGLRPYQADTLAAHAVQLLTGTAPVPSDHGRVPAGFDAWFARATHPQPDQRYPSARALADALAAALGQPLPERPASAPRRRWWMVPASAAVAVATGVFVSRSEPPEAPAPALAPVTSERPAPSDAGPSGAAVVDEPPTPSPTIQLHLHGVPDDAVVTDGAVELGHGPGPWSLPREDRAHRVRIVAPGFVPVVLKLVPNRDQTHTVTLIVSPSPKQTHRPHVRPPSANVDDLEF